MDDAGPRRAERARTATPRLEPPPLPTQPALRSYFTGNLTNSAFFRRTVMTDGFKRHLREMRRVAGGRGLRSPAPSHSAVLLPSHHV